MAFVLHTFPIKASQRGWPSEALGAGLIPVPERGGGARKGEARCNFDPVRLAGVTDLLVKKGPVRKGPGSFISFPVFSHYFQGIESLGATWMS